MLPRWFAEACSGRWESWWPAHWHSQVECVCCLCCPCRNAVRTVPQELDVGCCSLSLFLFSLSLCLLSGPLAIPFSLLVTSYYVTSLEIAPLTPPPIYLFSCHSAGMMHTFLQLKRKSKFYSFLLDKSINVSLHLQKLKLLPFIYAHLEIIDWLT